MMFQLNVSGRVDSHQSVKDQQGQVLGGDIILVEKRFVAGKQEDRVWNVHLGKATYERFLKAHVQIKYFGFQCWKLEVETVYASGKQEVMMWLHVSASDFFTL